MSARIYTIQRNWKNAWSNKAFRMDMLMVAILLPVVMFITHYFFCYIQGCTGRVMNDWILSRLPAIDVSFPISFLMTSTIILCFLRAINNPNMFICLYFIIPGAYHNHKRHTVYGTGGVDRIKGPYL